MNSACVTMPVPWRGRGRPCCDVARSAGEDRGGAAAAGVVYACVGTTMPGMSTTPCMGITR